MATLDEQFHQAATGARARARAAGPQAQAAQQRLDVLYSEATEGDPAGRDEAKRQFIALVGDLGQTAG